MPALVGLSASFEDNNGFIGDIGGHVLFSHYVYIDRLIDNLLRRELCVQMKIEICGFVVASSGREFGHMDVVLEGGEPS